MTFIKLPNLSFIYSNFGRFVENELLKFCKEISTNLQSYNVLCIRTKLFCLFKILFSQFITKFIVNIF